MSMSLRLMTSGGDRVGMAPPKAVEGYLICFLFGCSVPILLRKHETQNTCTIIGECYLDGCMEGETLQSGEYCEEVFVIV